jgi:hypothetical protein
LRLIWDTRGTTLLAADYDCPDDHQGGNGIHHIRFRDAQVVQITPDEVAGQQQRFRESALSPPPASYALGQDGWFRSFNSFHLEGMQHFQLIFYDDVLDVICSGLDCVAGPYSD